MTLRLEVNIEKHMVSIKLKVNHIKFIIDYIMSLNMFINTTLIYTF